MKLCVSCRRKGKVPQRGLDRPTMTDKGLQIM